MLLYSEDSAHTTSDCAERRRWSCCLSLSEANTNSRLWKWWSMWQQSWRGCSQRLLTSNHLSVCTYCLHKTNLPCCARWVKEITPSSGFQTTCELESKGPSHQEAVSVFSKSRESALCPGTEHRELLSAAKLPSDVTAAVPKADICPLTFLLQHITQNLHFRIELLFN